MTIIGLVRHGETEWNASGRIQGQTDIPLNEIGTSQAQKLAAYMKRDCKDWDYIYVSDLKRAHMTAQYIGDAINVPVYTDQRLRERSFGEAEGTTQQERIDKWGDNWRELIQGIESDAEVSERGKSFINELMSKHAGSRILIVSHGAYIANMLKTLMPAISTEERIENTSLTILKHAGENTWSCVKYNGLQHLQQA